MRKYRAVIFDLDGVICSTDHYHYLAWKQIADQEQIPFDETINNRLRGVSRMRSLEIILEQADRSYSEEEKQELAEQKNEIYRSLLVKMTSKDVAESMQDLLKQLRSAGVKIAIGSSSRNTKLILRQIGLGDTFDAISDGTDITHSKPHPEVFLIAAKKLGLPAGDCLVVEDAKAGIEAATAGGFDSAGIGEAATASGVTYSLRDIGELSSIVIP
ncbi:MAG: beta-phosphoglucomutase [Clostridiales bacterium]|nr:beta-phosphoglucomutase [Clostridiales bacterium]